VLVVDDNEDAANMLREALLVKAHDVRVVQDGPSALQMCEKFRPDVALLDIGLPVMDGYELANRLRDLPGLTGMRLVAVTGYGQETDHQRSRAAGFDRHLVKPVDLDGLERLLRDLGNESTPS
jgi:CheY-like chemotaxis protein